MNEKYIRKIYYYKNFYLEFFNSLNTDVQLKLNWTLQLISSLERVPEKYFKYLKDSNGIFEIRVEYASNTYRVFCFFDEGNIVILMNGIQKKTQKTPKNEITKAEKIKKQYLHEKTSK